MVSLAYCSKLNLSRCESNFICIHTRKYKIHALLIRMTKSNIFPVRKCKDVLYHFARGSSVKTVIFFFSFLFLANIKVKPLTFPVILQKLPIWPVVTQPNLLDHAFCASQSIMLWPSTGTGRPGQSSNPSTRSSYCRSFYLTVRFIIPCRYQVYS